MVTLIIVLTFFFSLPMIQFIAVVFLFVDYSLELLALQKKIMRCTTVLVVRVNTCK